MLTHHSTGYIFIICIDHVYLVFHRFKFYENMLLRSEGDPETAQGIIK